MKVFNYELFQNQFLEKKTILFFYRTVSVDKRKNDPDLKMFDFVFEWAQSLKLFKVEVLVVKHKNQVWSLYENWQQRRNYFFLWERLFNDSLFHLLW